MVFQPSYRDLCWNRAADDGQQLGLDVQTLRVVDPPHSPDLGQKMLGHLHGLWHMKLSKGFTPNLVSSLALTAEEPVEAPRSNDHDQILGHIGTNAGGVGASSCHIWS